MSKVAASARTWPDRTWQIVFAILLKITLPFVAITPKEDLKLVIGKFTLFNGTIVYHKVEGLGVVSWEIRKHKRVRRMGVWRWERDEFLNQLIQRWWQIDERVYTLSDAHTIIIKGFVIDGFAEKYMEPAYSFYWLSNFLLDCTLGSTFHHL